MSTDGSPTAATNPSRTTPRLPRADGSRESRTQESRMETPMQYDNSTKVIGCFTTHGFTPDHETDTQFVGSCVFCGKEGHFYINKNVGLWDCKACGASGNSLQFLARIQSEVYRPALNGVRLTALAEN